MIVLDVEETTSIRLTHSKNKSKAKSEDFYVQNIDLTKVDLYETFMHKKNENIDKFGSIVIGVHYSSVDLDITSNSDPYGPSITSICLNYASDVPTIIQRCIEYVEANGMKEVGIYRISGVTSRINNTKKLLLNDPFLNFNTITCDHNDLCGLIKMFFREIQEPLFPGSLKETLQELATSTHLDVETVSREKIDIIISQLPHANMSTLSHLIKHLLKVVFYESENKMGLANLSTVFGPSVFHNLFLKQTESSDSTLHIVFQVKLFRLLLSYYSQIN